MRLMKLRKNRGYTLLELLTVIFIIATLASMIIPNIRRALWKSQLSGCQSNLRNLATALQVYSNDNEGLYPSNLSLIAPRYMRSLPTCPAAHAESYTGGYQINAKYDVFTVRCGGTNHSVLNYGTNEPFYNLDTGLGPK